MRGTHTTTSCTSFDSAVAFSCSSGCYSSSEGEESFSDVTSCCSDVSVDDSHDDSLYDVIFTREKIRQQQQQQDLDYCEMPLTKCSRSFSCINVSNVGYNQCQNEGLFQNTNNLGFLALSMHINYGYLTVHVKEARDLPCSKSRDSLVHIEISFQSVSEIRKLSCCDQFDDVTNVCSRQNLSRYSSCSNINSSLSSSCKKNTSSSSSVVSTPAVPAACPKFDTKFTFDLSDSSAEKRLFITVWSSSTDKRSKSQLIGCMSFGYQRLYQLNQISEVKWFYLLNPEVGRETNVMVEHQYQEQKKSTIKAAPISKPVKQAVYLNSKSHRQSSLGRNLVQKRSSSNSQSGHQNKYLKHSTVATLKKNQMFNRYSKLTSAVKGRSCGKRIQIKEDSPCEYIEQVNNMTEDKRYVIPFNPEYKTNHIRHSIVLNRNEVCDGFGFSLVGSSPLVVGRVRWGSPADLGGLRQGDIIRGVGVCDVEGLNCQEVAELIRNEEDVLVLDITREFCWIAEEQKQAQLREMRRKSCSVTDLVNLKSLQTIQNNRRFQSTANLSTLPSVDKENKCERVNITQRSLYVKRTESKINRSIEKISAPGIPKRLRAGLKIRRANEIDSSKQYENVESLDASLPYYENVKLRKYKKNKTYFPSLHNDDVKMNSYEPAEVNDIKGDMSQQSRQSGCLSLDEESYLFDRLPEGASEFIDKSLDRVPDGHSGSLLINSTTVIYMNESAKYNNTVSEKNSSSHLYSNCHSNVEESSNLNEESQYYNDFTFYEEKKQTSSNYSNVYCSRVDTTKAVDSIFQSRMDSSLHQLSYQSVINCSHDSCTDVSRCCHPDGQSQNSYESITSAIYENISGNYSTVMQNHTYEKIEFITENGCSKKFSENVLESIYNDGKYLEEPDSYSIVNDRRGFNFTQHCSDHNNNKNNSTETNNHQIPSSDYSECHPDSPKEIRKQVLLRHPEIVTSHRQAAVIGRRALGIQKREAEKALSAASLPVRSCMKHDQDRVTLREGRMKRLVRHLRFGRRRDSKRVTFI